MQDGIDDRVVAEWSQRMQQAAMQHGWDLSEVHPFSSPITYDKVIEALRAGTPKGLECYRLILARLPYHPSDF